MPAFDFGEGTRGAGSGAAVGTAIAPGIGTAIGAGVGFVFGGLAGGKAKDEARKAALAKQRAALAVTSPETILANAQKFQRQFGATAALGGQALQSNVATNIARRGLTGTGLGTALKGAALSAPGIFAQRDALDRAAQVAGLQGAAITGVPSAFGAINPNTQSFGLGSPGFGSLISSLASLGLNAQGKSLEGPEPLSGPRSPLFPSFSGRAGSRESV